MAKKRSLRISSLVGGLILVGFLSGPQQILSCPVCYGANESSMFAGMNLAILTLIGITGTIFAGVVSFYFYMRKRIKMTLGGSVDPPSQN